MPETITDPADPRLRDYVGLTDVALRRVLEPEGGLYLAESEKVIRRSLAAGHRPRGLVIVISDLLSPGAHDGLHALVERGYEAVVAHVIDPSEIDPDLEGDLDLYDRETGEVVRIAADASLGARYRERVAAWISEQEALCARRQIRYVPVSTTVSVEDFLFHDARARRIVA